MGFEEMGKAMVVYAIGLVMMGAGIGIALSLYWPYVRAFLP